MIFLTTDQLLEESQRVAELQSDDFREAMDITSRNATDPSILELINILANNEGQNFVTVTKVWMKGKNSFCF